MSESPVAEWCPDCGRPVERDVALTTDEHGVEIEIEALYVPGSLGFHDCAWLGTE